jgi:hypothetical protein
MLSGYQVEVVGFFDNDDLGGAVCWQCALDQYGTLIVEKRRMGLTASVKLEPISRYTAGEYASENGYHCGCADDSEVEIPRDGEEPEGYEGPVDAGYYGLPMLNTTTNKVESPWHPLFYHEACATFNCDNCGEDMAS